MNKWMKLLCRIAVILFLFVYLSWRYEQKVGITFIVLLIVTSAVAYVPFRKKRHEMGLKAGFFDFMDFKSRFKGRTNISGYYGKIKAFDEYELQMCQEAAEDALDDMETWRCNKCGRINRGYACECGLMKGESATLDKIAANKKN